MDNAYGRLADLLALAGDDALLWVCNAATGSIAVSPALAELAGLAAPSGPDLAAAIHPDDMAEFLCGLPASVRRELGGESAAASATDASRRRPPLSANSGAGQVGRVQRTYRLRAGGGGSDGWRWFRDSVSTFSGEGGGGQAGCVGCVVEVQDAVEAQRILETFSGFFPEVVLIKADMQANLIWTSDPRDIYGQKWADFVHPADLPRLRAQLQKVAESLDADSGIDGSRRCDADDGSADGASLGGEGRGGNGDGNATTSSVRGLKLLSWAGERIRVKALGGGYEPYAMRFASDPQEKTFCCVSVNWAREAACEDALKATEARLNAALKACKAGTYDWEVESNQCFMTPDLAELFGFSNGEEVAGSGLAGLALLNSRRVPGDECPMNEMWEQSAADKPVTAQTEHRVSLADRPGEIRWLRHHAVRHPCTRRSSEEPLSRPPMPSDGISKPFSRQIGIFFDITEEKAAKEALRHARDEAEASSKAKSFFVANMSHEIRTPLNAVLGCGTLLKHTVLTDEQSEFVRMIQSSGEALMGIINNILDFTKVETGHMALEAAPFAIYNVIREALDQVRHQAEAKGLDVRCTVDPDVPAVVLGDSVRLRQVLINLLNNSCKFTAEGFIGLEVMTARRLNGGSSPEHDEDQSATTQCVVGPTEASGPAGAASRVAKTTTSILRFAMVDSGIGVPDDRKHLLFQAFSQGDTSITRLYGGSGLGLAICSRLVGLMGGMISHADREGGGSIFAMELPFAAPAPLDAAGQGRGDSRLEANLDAGLRLLASPMSEAPASSSLTVAALAEPGREVPAFTSLAALAEAEDTRFLVVDDNAVNQRVLAHMLKRFGLRNLAFASNGQEAVEMVAEGAFGVVLMDLWMPVMDGKNAAATIKASAPEVERPVVVAVTAAATVEEREACYNAGMEFFLAKPIRIDGLASVLEDSLTLLRRRRAGWVLPGRQEAPLT